MVGRARQCLLDGHPCARLFSRGSLLTPSRLENETVGNEWYRTGLWWHERADQEPYCRVEHRFDSRQLH
jgi:hypothetical protein